VSHSSLVASSCTQLPIGGADAAGGGATVPGEWGVYPPPHAQHMTLAVKSSSSFMNATLSHTSYDGIDAQPYSVPVTPLSVSVHGGSYAGSSYVYVYV